MNAFELLKQDHRKVSGIFKQLETGGSTGRRDELFAQLKNELEVHAHIEETIFYPALKQNQETRDLVAEAIDEHNGVKVLLAELEAMPKDDEQWNERLTELRENVEHHVEEEEGEMFDAARQVLSHKQVEELGARMEREKQQRAATAGAR